MMISLLIQWSLWTVGVFAGGAALLALRRVKDAERFLPDWDHLQSLGAELVARTEALRQTDEAIEAKKPILDQLQQAELSLARWRGLQEWLQQNPDAEARIKLLQEQLERARAELAAVQEALARGEAQKSEMEHSGTGANT